MPDRRLRRPPGEPHWSSSAWGRIAVGVFVSQGLYWALYHFLLAGALAANDEQDTQLASFYGVVAIQAVQIATLLAGGILAGVGVRHGLLFGSIIGVWNGILATLFQSLQGAPITPVFFYGTPVLHTAFGAVGGLLGSAIWPPFGSHRYQLDLPKHTVFKPKPEREILPVRLNWLKILVGSAIVVAGILFADSILQVVIKASENRINLRTEMEQRLITVEIGMLAAFIGACVAGAGTTHGGAHGAWVALLSSASLIGYSFFYRDLGSTGTVLLMAGGVICLSYLGGSFAGRLLPPLPPRAMRRNRPASLSW